jgi:hypothetical protein
MLPRSPAAVKPEVATGAELLQNALPNSARLLVSPAVLGGDACTKTPWAWQGDDPEVGCVLRGFRPAHLAPASTVHTEKLSYLQQHFASTGRECTVAEGPLACLPFLWLRYLPCCSQRPERRSY